MDNTTDNKSENKFGKFSSADELMLAYNALESEFTKRCQLVKQLQAELDAMIAQAGDTQNIERQAEPDSGTRSAQNACDGVAPESAQDTASPPDAPSAPTVGVDAVGEFIRNAEDYAEALASVPEVFDACVALYKKRLIQSARGIGASPVSGMAVIMPAARPRTLSDAKKIADSLLS